MKVIEDNQAESSKKRQASELAMNNYVKSVTLYCCIVRQKLNMM